jgi:hypothetical protein
MKRRKIHPIAAAARDSMFRMKSGGPAVLTQAEADELMGLIKILLSHEPIRFPRLGEQEQYELKDKETGSITFTIDVQRKTVNVNKCTYQTRAMGHRLLRIDLAGAPHPNPDGTEVPCPHIHIYREGFEDSWAYPLSDYMITDTNDLVRVLIDFLEYNHVENIPHVIVDGSEII